MSRPTLQRLLITGGAAGAAVASARYLFKPMPGTSAELMDWDRVRTFAIARSGERSGKPIPAELSSQYDAYALGLAGPMADVLGREPVSFPQFRAIDRRGFIDANVAISRRLMGPLEQLRTQLPESRASAWGRTAMDRYVGELLGFMSRRVLGQYDPVLMLGDVEPDSPTALYLVEPNLAHYEKQHKVPGVALRRWLILHEMTHAWQFEEHAWLRPYITAEIATMLESALPRPGPDGKSLPSLSAQQLLRRLPTTVRGQLRGLARIQAVMSLLEGYSNFVMNRVGRQHLEHFAELETAFHRRKQERSALEKLVLAITGMNMKLRQYEIGEKFCKAVDARGGVELVNRVWDGPEFVPTMAELKTPQLWIARVGAA